MAHDQRVLKCKQKKSDYFQCIWCKETWLLFESAYWDLVNQSQWTSFCSYLCVSAWYGEGTGYYDLCVCKISKDLQTLLHIQWIACQTNRIWQCILLIRMVFSAPVSLILIFLASGCMLHVPSNHQLKVDHSFCLPIEKQFTWHRTDIRWNHSSTYWRQIKHVDNSSWLVVTKTYANVNIQLNSAQLHSIYTVINYKIHAQISLVSRELKVRVSKMPSILTWYV